MAAGVICLGIKQRACVGNIFQLKLKKKPNNENQLN